MSKTTFYTIVHTCGQEVATYAYWTEKEAIKCIEERSGQKQNEWAFDNGTAYLGDNNYEAVMWYDKTEIEREEAENA